MNNTYITGVGSRRAPLDILVLAEKISYFYTTKGAIIRSGGAAGMDTAFEIGAFTKEVYLPWVGFNDNPSRLFGVNEDALKIAEEFHPNWKNLAQPSRLLMGRNVYQILGKDLQTPSDCVVCWTPDGCEDGRCTTNRTGGTGQALRIAAHYSIPIFNLKNTRTRERFELYVAEYLS